MWTVGVKNKIYQVQFLRKYSIRLLLQETRVNYSRNVRSIIKSVSHLAYVSFANEFKIRLKWMRRVGQSILCLDSLDTTQQAKSFYCSRSAHSQQWYQSIICLVYFVSIYAGFRCDEHCVKIEIYHNNNNCDGKIDCG